MIIRKNAQIELEYADISALRPYPGNAREHTVKQLNKIAKQIEAVGFINPITVDETGMILAGHGRYEAAKLIGLTIVPVIKARGLSEIEKRSHILADNRLGDESKFSTEKVKVELKSLIELGANLELTGFDTLQIDTYLTFDDSQVALEDNVHLPNEKAVPVSRLDDLWHIGRHRVLCGDAREFANYERLLEGEQVALYFVDPPYGCAIAGNVSGLGKIKHDNFLMGAGEQSLPDFAQSLLRPVFRCMAAMSAPGAIAFVCTDWKASVHMLDASQGVFAELKQWIVWAKTNSGMGTFYRSAHEFILVFKVKPGKHQNNFELGQSGRHRSNLWTYAGANTFRRGRMQDLKDHATVKPKALVADALLDCSKQNDVVFDSFLGSGTTLLACEMTNRIGRGIELDPRFVDVILRRLSEATGCEPLLDGVTPFSVVAAERLGEEV